MPLAPFLLSKFLSSFFRRKFLIVEPINVNEIQFYKTLFLRFNAWFDHFRGFFVLCTKFQQEEVLRKELLALKVLPSKVAALEVTKKKVTALKTLALKIRKWKILALKADVVENRIFRNHMPTLREIQLATGEKTRFR